MKRRQTNPALSLSPTLTALAMVTWSLVLTQAAHAECDFDKPVGGCKGKITIDKASGSKGSYSAELTVSSTQSCSKVEFFLDNTPHTSIIRNRRSEDESVFGTKPITKKNVSVGKCTAYANLDKARKDNDEQDGSTGPKFFEGHWAGSAGLLVFRGPVEVTIRVNGNRAVGSTYFPGNGITEQVDGVIRGNSLSYSYTDEETMNITLTKKGPNSVSYVGSGSSGVTITGTLTRR